jgi:AraC-like DNA-binding protein
MARFDPTRPDFSPYGFSCVRWTPTAMPRFDRHNEIELNLLESGSLMYLMGGRRLVVTAGRLTVFWAGVPHQILDFEEVVDYFVLTIPLAWFLQWPFPDDFAQRILHGETVVEPDEGRLATDTARFEQWSEDAQLGSDDRRHISLLEIEARLRRLALSTAVDRNDRSRRKASSKLDRRNVSRAEQMARFIAQHYTQPLTAEMIGRHVSLHPNYAMTLFQQTFGTTLIKYATEHRLMHAQRLLLTTVESIANIAFSSGFGSLSRFNEAFRQAFGCTPREYRKQQGNCEETCERTQ